MLRRASSATLAVLVAACSSETVQPLESEIVGGTYFGVVNGSDAVLAISVDGDIAVAYVCGGTESLETSTRWYRGTVTDGKATLEALTGQTLNVTFEGDEAVGTFIDWEGETFSFDALGETEDRFHELYMVLDSGCRTGVVVKKHAGGEEVVQGAWCNDLGIFEQVTPIAPIEVGAAQLSVEVSGLEPKTLTVTAVDPNAF